MTEKEQPVPAEHVKRFNDVFAAELERVAKIRSKKDQIPDNKGKIRDNNNDEYKKDHKRINGKPLAGLALSGGGIRSAAFSLGVLQAFANNDILRQFDYLSTVSGGGFAGTALTWLLSPRYQKDRNKCEQDPESNGAFTIEKEN